jgi:hypothetical protein
VNLGTSCANLDPGISNHCSSPDPKSIILDICRVNPRQLTPTVRIAATGFCNPGEILQLFHREDQQILWLPDSSSQIVSTERISLDRLHRRNQRQLSSTSSRSSRLRRQQSPSSSKSTNHGTSRKIGLQTSNSNLVQRTKFQATIKYANSYLLKLYRGDQVKELRVKSRKSPLSSTLRLPCISRRFRFQGVPCIDQNPNRSCRLGICWSGSSTGNTIREHAKVYRLLVRVHVVPKNYYEDYQNNQIKAWSRFSQIRRNKQWTLAQFGDTSWPGKLTKNPSLATLEQHKKERSFYGADRLLVACSVQRFVKT